jgi:hypothetical protein
MWGALSDELSVTILVAFSLSHHPGGLINVAAHLTDSLH